MSQITCPSGRCARGGINPSLTRPLMVLRNAAGCTVSRVRCGEHKNAAHRPSTRPRSSQTLGSIEKEHTERPGSRRRGAQDSAAGWRAVRQPFASSASWKNKISSWRVITGGTFPRTLSGLDTVPQVVSARWTLLLEARKGIRVHRKKLHAPFTPSMLQRTRKTMQ